MRLLNFVVYFCVLAATPAFSQTLGEITGQVTDSTGAAVPGAKITATNAGTNATRDAVSNDSGVYSFPALQPGTYNVRVEKSGFKTVTRANIQLEVQQNARVDFELPLGQVSETMEVAADAALLATENATVGTV